MFTSTNPRRSARIAARNAAKTKVEAVAAAHTFHESQIYNNNRRFVQNAPFEFVQNDLGGYNNQSLEYRVAVELMKKNTEATTEIARTEAISSVFAWVIEHPHLLHQIPSLPKTIYAKITELSPLIDNKKARLLLLYSTDSAAVRREKAMIYGAFSKLQAYIHIMHYLLHQMSA
jgi:hypothetical protein